MTNYEIIEKFESDKVKSSLDIAGGVFVETDLVHEIVKALRSQPCEDTISRQAAIDALCKQCTVDRPETCSTIQKGDKWCEEVYTLLKLPSAQPEITRCKDCGHFHYDMPYVIQGVPVLGHEVCAFWGDGC